LLRSAATGQEQRGEDSDPKYKQISTQLRPPIEVVSIVKTNVPFQSRVPWQQISKHFELFPRVSAEETKELAGHNLMFLPTIDKTYYYTCLLRMN
jgi:hypothetical protein